MSTPSHEPHAEHHNHTRWSARILGTTAGLLLFAPISLAIYKAFSGAVSRAASPKNSPAIAPPAVNDSTSVAAPDGLGRAGDKDIQPASGPEAEERENLGIILVLFAFLASIGGGIGFIYVYWFHPGSNRLLGGTLAISLVGLGIALVLWAHWLMIQREAVEPREELTSSAGERNAAVDEFYTGEHQIRRRRVLIGMSTAVVGIFVAALVSLLRSFATPPGPALFPTVWKRGQRLMTEKGQAVSVDALKLGDTITVFPEDSIGSINAQTVLIRVPEQFLRLPKGRSAWTPMGYVAYSRVCTHAGCPVGEYEPRSNLLLCPCHQSTFDVLNAAQPTSGPAARPLPQLPLYAGPDGILRAAGDFTQPPGPGFWGMPEARSLS